MPDFPYAIFETSAIDIHSLIYTQGFRATPDLVPRRTVSSYRVPVP
jgi:hypothetical protein